MAIKIVGQAEPTGQEKSLCFLLSQFVPQLDVEPLDVSVCLNASFFSVHISLKC